MLLLDKTAFWICYISNYIPMNSIHQFYCLEITGHENLLSQSFFYACLDVIGKHEPHDSDCDAQKKHQYQTDNILW